MVPPSRHESGVEYSWIPGNVGQAQPVPHALEDLRTGPQGSPQRHRKRAIPAGQRNDTLFRTACGLRRWAEDDETIFEMMKIMNERLCRC